MAIGVGTPNSTFGFITGATISVDAGSGSDRYLLAFAIGSRQIDGNVTYDGVTMDLIAGTGATGLHGAIYGLANPPTGAHNLDIQVVGNANVLIAGVGLDGVDQVTPHGTGSETTGTGSPLSGSVSDSATGDVVFAAGFIGHTAGGGTITKDASQTNLVENDAPDGARSMSISYKAGAAGTFTMQCTATQATGGGWVHVMVNIKAAGGGGSTYTLDADAGSYAITGTAAALEHGYLIDADTGSYAISGQDAALQQGYQVAVDAGAYAISGSDADFIYNRAIDADAGSYLINGAAASLEYTPSGSTYNLDAEGGAYLITGSDAALDYVQLIHRILDADVGSYLISGSDALLEYSGAPSSVQGVMLRPGGVTHNRRTKAQKDTRRRRILLPDGRILIPADDAEYRRAVDQIVANLESGEESAEPPKPARKRLRGAVVAPAAVPKLAPVQALPAEFYTALEFNRQGVLNYLSILAAWQGYLAEMDEDEAVTLLLLN